MSPAARRRSRSSPRVVVFLAKIIKLAAHVKSVIRLGITRSGRFPNDIDAMNGTAGGAQFTTRGTRLASGVPAPADATTRLMTKGTAVARRQVRSPGAGIIRDAHTSG